MTLIWGLAIGTIIFGVFMVEQFPHSPRWVRWSCLVAAVAIDLLVAYLWWLYIS